VAEQVDPADVLQIQPHQVGAAAAAAYRAGWSVAGALGHGAARRGEPLGSGLA
jgi:hypothetical protein